MEWPGQSDILKHFFYVIKHVFLNDVNNLTILSKILSLVLLYIHLFFPCRENLFSSCFILDHPYSSCCTEIPQFHIFSCKTWISCIRKLLFFFYCLAFVYITWCNFIEYSIFFFNLKNGHCFLIRTKTMLLVFFPLISNKIKQSDLFVGNVWGWSYFVAVYLGKHIECL